MRLAIHSIVAVVALTVSVATGIAQSTDGTLQSYKLEKTLLGPWDPVLSTQPFFMRAPSVSPECQLGCALTGLAVAALFDLAEASVARVYVMSSDGLHFAFVSVNKHVCGEGSKICAVVDGQVHPAQDAKSVGYLSFAPDNRHFKYRVKAKDSSWVDVALVLQGDRWVPAESGQAAAASQPAPAPPGTAPGFTPLNPDLPHSDTIHSPDGTRTATVEFKRGRDPYTVVVDGQASAKYLKIGRSSPLFSPDGKHVAFAAFKIGGWVVVLDGHESRKKYDKVGPLIFSPDGSHLAFSADTSHFKPWTVIVDDHDCGYFQEVGEPVFSPDGKHLAFVAAPTISANKWSMIVDSVKGEEFEGILEPLPIFSPDGTLQYLAHTHDSLYRVKYTPTQ